MKKIISLLFIAIPYYSFAQNAAEKPRILYGTCTKDSLTVEPFVKWFNAGYDSYSPNTTVVSLLKKQT